MSFFWQLLLALLAIRLGMSTAFHPQTDGQMERVNQSLEQYLRMFCNYDQDDWYELLPLAEYVYNNSITSAIGFTPFYANYGFNPKTMWLKQADAKNPAATYYAHWMEQVHRRCLEHLEQTRDRMGKYYDRTRTSPPPFKPGDKVLLDSRNLRTVRSSKKLNHKIVGPFPILDMVSTHTA